MRPSFLLRLVRNLAHRPGAAAVAVLAASVALGSAVAAQTGGGVDLSWSVTGAGGQSAAGVFQLSDTLGQPDVAVSNGGAWEVQGGFWAWDGVAQSIQPVHVIAILSFDNDLSQHTSRVIENFRLGTESEPNVSATLLVDGEGGNNTRVLRVLHGAVTPQDVPGLSGELNTASPDVIATFIAWARRQVSDTRTVVALLGHGAGFTPYVSRSAPSAPQAVVPPLPQGADRTASDVTSGSYLSTPELGHALRQGIEPGWDTYDLLVLDSCFEGNLDVLYEIRDTAQVIVASPNYAWATFAYERYLPRLVQATTPEEMGQAVVDEYEAALDDHHPNAIFWMRGADIGPLADAVSSLGDALRAAVSSPPARAGILDASLHSQFADTTLCAGDLDLCPPDEMIGLGSFARGLQAAFPAGDVHVAATGVLDHLANVYGAHRTGSPWVKPATTWSYTDTLTILAPLTPTLSADVVWRASVYTSATSLVSVWSPEPTRTVVISEPLAYAVQGRWDDFLSRWYGGALTPTVGQWCHAYPPAASDVTTPSQPIALSAESGYGSIQLDWNASNSPHIIGYQVSRAASGTAGLSPIAVVTETRFFDVDSALVNGQTYCYQIGALAIGGVVITSSNATCAPFGLVELWMPESRGQPGATALIPINIRNAQGLRLAATDIWLEFDGRVIEPLYVTRTALTAGYSWVYSITSTQHYSRAQISAIASPPPELYGDGSLFWLAVRVRGQSDATTTLDLREFVAGVGGSTLYAPDDPSAIPLLLRDAQFQVAAGFALGDLNGNGVVQAIDAWTALQIASGAIVPSWEQRQAGDVNGDGQVTAADATMILYFAAHGAWPPVQAGARSPAGAAPESVASAVMVSLDSVAGMMGESVNVPLRASGLLNWAGGDFTVAFDPSVLSVAEVRTSDLSTGFSLSYDAQPGLLRIALASGLTVSGSGPIATIRFAIRPDVPAHATALLSLADARLNDVTGRDFATSALQQAVTRQGGQVTVGVLRIYLPAVRR